MHENISFAEEHALMLARLTLAACSLLVMALFWNIERRKQASHTMAWNIGPKNRRYVCPLGLHMGRKLALVG
jgi:hypothetical protein